MVRVVKRFKTSDGDSDMRGFESHHAPHDIDIKDSTININTHDAEWRSSNSSGS